MLLKNGQVLPDSMFAETTPTITNGYFYGKDGLDLTRAHATYAQLYKSQPWVTTLVDKVASSASRLQLKCWDVASEKSKIAADSTPLGKLIANPSTSMDSVSFWHWIQSTKEIYGEAFVLKVRKNPNAAPSSLLPMHPSRTIVKREADGKLKYIFSLGVASAGLFTAERDDVIPFLRYNPDTQLRGLSRLEALRSTLLNEDAARRAQASFWDKGARPSVFLSHPKELSNAASTKLQAQFAAMNTGPDNAGRVAVLEEGATAQVVQLSMEEMQYIEGRKMNREEVCAVYDVPPPVVHILDRATFSNITEQMRSMYRDTMMPRLSSNESVLDYYLRPEFDSSGALKIEYSLDEVLRGDYEKRAESAVKLVDSGIMTPGEARPMFGLGDAGEIANSLYANVNLVKLGESVRQAGNTDPNAIAMDNAINGAKAMDEVNEVRSVAGILGREQSIDGMKQAMDNLLAEGISQNVVNEAFERVSRKRAK